MNSEFSNKGTQTRDKLYLNQKEFKKKQCFNEIIDLIDHKKIYSFLDIGCSNGSFLYSLKNVANKKSRLVGLDLDENLVSKSKNNLPELEFYHHDIKNNCPENLRNKFDYVTLLGVHNAFDDLEFVLSSCSEFLSKNGKLIIFGAFSSSNFDLIARIKIPGNNGMELGFNRHSLLSLRLASESANLIYLKEYPFYMKTKIEKTDDPLRGYHSHFDKEDYKNSVLRNDVELLINQFIVLLEKK